MLFMSMQFRTLALNLLFAKISLKCAVRTIDSVPILSIDCITLREQIQEQNCLDDLRSFQLFQFCEPLTCQL